MSHHISLAIMPIKKSLEQEKICSVESGSYAAVANAGSGKTTTLASLILNVYLAEVKKLFPFAGGNLSDKDKIEVLDNILCLTFTTKAAEELDRKIKALLAENGVEPPRNRWGKMHRIARTYDSYVREWLLKDRVFDAWMKTDPDVATRLCTIARGFGVTDVRRLARAWPWPHVAQVEAFLLETTIGEYFGTPQKGISGQSIAEKFDDFLSTLTFDGKSFDLSPFWAPYLDSYQANCSRMRVLKEKAVKGEVPADDPALIEWDRVVGVAKEFQGVHSIARARGYHPCYRPELLANNSVERALSVCEHVDSYYMFSEISEIWHEVKTHFLYREFGDQSLALYNALRGCPSLLESEKEYPHLVRRKYVAWDEVQDNDYLQNQIRAMMVSQTKPFLSVSVGDPKQQIYVWRGADQRGFLEMIKKYRSAKADSILTLTCSFRSARSIVELGNEIISTLPSYRDNVVPSTTIYEEKGEVEITKPFMSVDEESSWVAERIQAILDTSNRSVMVLSRVDIRDSPLYKYFLSSHPELGKRLTAMTAHKAKGLEADVVIVLGLVAGVVPDVRSGMDEEVNLFYVMCTRARLSLILCGLVARREIDKKGHVVDSVVGPTPFFLRLPILKGLALASGWPEELLRKGVDTHGQSLAIFLTRMEKRMAELKRERVARFPVYQLPGETAAGLTDYGIATEDVVPVASDAVRRLEGTEPSRSPRVPSLPAMLVGRVTKKLLNSYNMRGSVPKLSPDEFSAAVRLGLIYRPKDGGRWGFTMKLSELAKPRTS